MADALLLTLAVALIAIAIGSLIVFWRDMNKIVEIAKKRR